MTWTIVHTEWSDGFGGQELRILQECREMTRRGHRLTILCRPEAALREKGEEAGIRVVPVPIRSPADLVSVVSMARLFRGERVDIVNTHSGKDTWVASMAAKIAGVPLLLRTRHISLPVRRRPWNLVWYWPDGYITTGEPIREHLIHEGVPADRVVSIPTGVDGDRFSPAVSGDPIRRELEWTPGRRVISMIGVLRASKRLDLFLDVAAEISRTDRSLAFLIVGEGPKEPEIREKIRDLRLEDVVFLLGQRADIPEILAATDVVVTTSVKEGLPQVILQALAMERPVVASRVGAIPEVVVHEETGLLCPAADVGAFVAAVRRFLSDPALGRRLGEAGRRLVLENHSVSVMGDKTEAFYRFLAQAKGGSAR